MFSFTPNIWIWAGSPAPPKPELWPIFLRRKYAAVKLDALITVYPSTMDILLGERGTLFPDVPIVAGEISRSYAGNLTLRIMAGKSPSALPFGGDEAYVELYDWRELKRWSIPESAFPPGGLVRYRQFSLWEDHWREILGAIFLILSEGALTFGLVVNLRRRKKAEQSLVESEMRLNLAADSAGAGLWRLNVNTGQIWATERALELYGFSPGHEVDFKKFLAIVHDEDREQTLHSIEKAIRDKKELSHEYRITLPDGSIRWMAVKGGYIPLLDGSDNLTGVSIDNTERKKTEGALRQGKQELRDLMGRLITVQEEERSHIARELHDDITQRLAVLAIEIGTLELQREPDSQNYREKLHTIKESLVRLSEDIHALSRQLHPSILDDLGLVRAVEAESDRFSRKKGIRVFFNHEELPPAIPRDIALALYRVTQEGLRNIAKHSGATTAHVELQGLPDAIFLTVADTGCGFDSRNGRQKPGVGLASMKERIELVHGSITIDSTPGEGTVINVRVPLI